MRVLGWIALVGGSALSLLLGGLTFVLFPGSPAGWFVLGAGMVLAIGIAMLMLFGGKTIEKSGHATEKEAYLEAVFALARVRGGQLSIGDVTRATGLPRPRAEELLTDLAKADADQVRLEVDDHGRLLFQFPAFLGPQIRVAGAGVRVTAPSSEVLEGEEEEAEEKARRRRQL